jgi:hypothetical protein
MRLIVALALAGTAFGQAINGPSSPTNTPNQINVTTAWLYLYKMHYAGTWSSSTTYNSEDLVFYMGGAYISLLASNLDNVPSSGAPWWVAMPGGSGSGLTSVGLTMPNWFAVANSPLTSNGTIGVSEASGQSSHQVIGTCGSATSFGPCTLGSSDLPTVYYQTLQYNTGTKATQRSVLNLIPGTNISISEVDDSGNGSTDVTIAATAGGGATKLNGTATFSYSSAIADGDCLQGPSAITVTGANVGDPVYMGTNAVLSQGIDVFGKVTASSTVTVEVCNLSGSSTTPGSITYSATVIH